MAQRHIVVYGELWQDNGHYVMNCPQLGVASQGRSAEVAYANTHSAAQVYVNALTLAGDLDRVIKEKHLDPKPGNAPKSIAVGPVEKHIAACHVDSPKPKFMTVLAVDIYGPEALKSKELLNQPYITDDVP